jgi:hypothetical protein
VECLAAGGWWIHLRRCTQCGHIGCCDTSPAQHATAHAEATGHPIVVSFEPGESWYWNYVTSSPVDDPGDVELLPPHERPVQQNPPAPRANVPADWRDHLH